MIRIHVLAGCFLFVSMNNMIVSSLKPEDRVIRTKLISDGRVEECFGSVYYFYPDLEKPVWKGSDWKVCKIIVDPVTESIKRVETEVDENGKKVIYLLPDENPHFKRVIEDSRGQVKRAIEDSRGQVINKCSCMLQ